MAWWQARCGQTIPHAEHVFDGGAVLGEHAVCSGVVQMVVAGDTPVQAAARETLDQAAAMASEVAGMLGANKDEQQRLHDSLARWWNARSADEIEAVVPKAVEYSAADLVWIGRTLGLVLGRDGLSDEEATELGIFFYQVGKIGRWVGAVKDGRRPSDDTIHDIGIYTKMAQRNRDVGGWPFAHTTNGEEATDG